MGASILTPTMSFSEKYPANISSVERVDSVKAHHAYIVKVPSDRTHWSFQHQGIARPHLLLLHLKIPLDCIRICGWRRIRISTIRSRWLCAICRSRSRCRLWSRSRSCCWRSHLRRLARLPVCECVCRARLLAWELSVRCYGAVALCGSAMDEVDDAFFVLDLFVARVGVGGYYVLRTVSVGGGRRW